MITAALAASLVLTGSCGRIPPTHYYVIEIQSSRPAESEPPVIGEGLVVGVEAFHVDPPYDQDRIVYRAGAGAPEVGFYTYHRWAAPLSRMLPAAVAAALDGMPGIARIDPVAPGRDYTAVLGGRVRSLEEIDVPEGQRVVLSQSLELRVADGRVIWTGEVDGERLVRATEVGEVVAALTDELQVNIEALRPALQRALAAHAAGEQAQQSGR